MNFMKGIIIVCKVIHVDTLFITASDRLTQDIPRHESVSSFTLHGFREKSILHGFFFTFLGLGDEKSLKPGWLVIGEFDIGIAPGRF